MGGKGRQKIIKVEPGAELRWWGPRMSFGWLSCRSLAPQESIITGRVYGKLNLSHFNLYRLVQNANHKSLYLFKLAGEHRRRRRCGTKQGKYKNFESAKMNGKKSYFSIYQFPWLTDAKHCFKATANEVVIRSLLLQKINIFHPLGRSTTAIPDDEPEADRQARMGRSPSTRSYSFCVELAN